MKFNLAKLNYITSFNERSEIELYNMKILYNISI